MNLALDGYKSYIFGGLIVVITLLYAFKMIDENIFRTLFGIFTGGGIVSLRRAVKKNGTV